MHDEKRKKTLERMKQYMEEFRNRGIYSSLTTEILKDIPEDKIEQVIIDYVRTKIKDWQNEYDVISRLSIGFQTIYSLRILDAEVNNGGFNQFFFNSSGQFAQMALRSLKLIDATDYYDILERAIEIHAEEENNSTLQDLYSQGTLQAFSESYKITSLGECDKAFYKLNNQLRELRLEYIRANLNLFVGS